MHIANNLVAAHFAHANWCSQIRNAGADPAGFGHIIPIPKVIIIFQIRQLLRLVHRLFLFFCGLHRLFRLQFEGIYLFIPIQWMIGQFFFLCFFRCQLWGLRFGRLWRFLRRLRQLYLCFRCRCRDLRQCPWSFEKVGGNLTLTCQFVKFNPVAVLISAKA